jgi:hypothetical protein
MNLKQACSGVRKREKRSVQTAIALGKVIAEVTVSAIYPIEIHGIGAFKWRLCPFRHTETKKTKE